MSTDSDSQQEASDPEASKQPDQGDKSIDKKADGVVDSPAQEKQSSDASTDPDSQQEASDSEASKQPDQDSKSIDKKSDDVADPSAQERQNPNASSELIVLSPRYDEKHHGLYVNYQDRKSVV